DRRGLRVPPRRGHARRARSVLPRLGPRQPQAPAPLRVRRSDPEIASRQAVAAQAQGRRVRSRTRWRRGTPRGRRRMTPLTFADSRLATLDGFRVEIDAARERADVILDRPPFNVVSMPQRDQLRLVFENLDQDARVRIIVLRAAGEHFSSGGNIKGFLEASPEQVSRLAWNVAAPARCAKPVIAANRGYCFGVGFELSLACGFRIASEACQYALPGPTPGQTPGSGGA